MKYAVIIRQLPGSRPVATGVIQDPKDPEIDNLNHYFKSKGEEIIENFKKQLPEFKEAAWYIDIVEMY